MSFVRATAIIVGTWLLGGIALGVVMQGIGLSSNGSGVVAGIAGFALAWYINRKDPIVVTGSQAPAGASCGNCGKTLSPVWRGKCLHCKAMYTEFPPVAPTAEVHSEAVPAQV
jgi:hypothetical protein